MESMGIDKSFSLVALEGIFPGQEVYWIVYVYVYVYVLLYFFFCFEKKTS